MYCIYKMNNIHKQNGNILYMKSLVPKRNKRKIGIEVNFLFDAKCVICRVILLCFLLFFLNRDKRQSPFSAECNKSTQPITALHSTHYRQYR